MSERRPLTELCREHGITLTELSERTGIPRGTLKKWGVDVAMPGARAESVLKGFEGRVTLERLLPLMTLRRKEAA